MIKKASDMEKNESGVVESISGYKNELKCMGITKGCRIMIKSDKNKKLTVISDIKNKETEIILLNLVASEISVKTERE